MKRIGVTLITFVVIAMLTETRVAVAAVNATAPAASFTSPSKSEAIAFLTSLREQNTARLREIDSTLRRKVDESSLAIQIADVDQEIDKLRAERRELSLRQDFLDRLTLQFDTKYDGRDIKAFVTAALRAMTKVEVGASSQHSIWKFTNYLSIAIQKAPERQDKVLAFVEGYMKQTSIEAPVRPDDYISKMAYTNGSQVEAATPGDPTEAGEIAERRLEQIRVQQLRAKAPSTP